MRQLTKEEMKALPADGWLNVGEGGQMRYPETFRDAWLIQTRKEWAFYRDMGMPVLELPGQYYVVPEL